jgi:hypothetical protein
MPGCTLDDENPRSHRERYRFGGRRPARGRVQRAARGRLAAASLAALAIAATAAAPIGGTSAHPSAQRHFRATCHSGKTEFRKGGLRVFKISSKDAHSGGTHERLLMCTATARKPRLILDGGADANVLPSSFALEGTRLGFEVETVAFMGAFPVAPTEIGWIDLRRGPARLGLLNAGAEPQYVEPEEPLLPVHKVHFAIAADGSMAVITSAQSGCQVVAVLTLRRPRSARLELPRVLDTARHGGLDPASLTIDDTTVAWRTSSGLPGSAMRAAGTPAAGTPSAQTGGC